MPLPVRSGEEPLVYSPRVVRAPVNGFGRAGAYLALFSEIGIVLLATTLIGVLGGYWADTNLKTLPIFVLVGLFLGLAAGALAVHRLITRFLARFE